MKMFFKIIANILSAIFVIVVLLLLISSFRIPIFPLDTRAVLSGSMEPAITTGSVVFIYPRESYDEGDVITFRRKDSSLELPITHRIVGKEIVDGVVTYQTQGDANEYVDGGVVLPDEIYGKVIFHIPFLGRLLDFVKTPIGFSLLIIIPALLVIFDEIKKIRQEFVKGRKDKDEVKDKVVKGTND
jgi:signal peptidase